VWATVVNTDPSAGVDPHACERMPPNADDGASHNPTAMRTAAPARFIGECFEIVT
jgi:hypothetical protein